MSKQKGFDVVKGLIVDDDTKELVGVINKLPLEYKMMLAGQALMLATVKGIDISGIVPPPTKKTLTRTKTA